MKRPSAVITRDDWFGHRDPLTAEPLGDRDEWIDWDHAIIDAFQTIEDYTDSESGHLQWELDDEAVVIDAVPYIHKFREAIDQVTQKPGYKAAPGERYRPKMWSRRKDEFGEDKIQSYSEWILSKIDKR